MTAVFSSLVFNVVSFYWTCAKD